MAPLHRRRRRDSQGPPRLRSPARSAQYSYYDDAYVDGARGLDIDHLVPLAESWDSGASNWDAKRREAHANDLGAETSLIAVTARSNRSKDDRKDRLLVRQSRDRRSAVPAAGARFAARLRV